MASLFKSLEAQELTEDEKPIFDVLKASLQYPSNEVVLENRLADDIVFFCRSARGDEDYEAILTAVWPMIFDMICCTPPDHPWQDVLANAIKEVKGRGTLPARNGDSYDHSWEELPCLFIELNAHMDRVFEKDVQFQNLNSFAARLYATGALSENRNPIARLRDALEKPLHPSSGYLLWVASEWLIRCADGLYTTVAKCDFHPEKTGWWHLGEFFTDKQDVTPFSIGRWNLWKKRISEERSKLVSTSTEPGTLVLEESAASALAERLEKALKSMEQAEKTAP